jgi:hypothetical protein
VLRDFQCIIDFDSKVSHGAFQLGVTKQELDGPQVLGSFADQCCHRPSHAVRVLGRRIEPDGGKPLVYDPGILASRNMRRFRLTIGEQIVLGLQIRLFDPCRDRGSRRLGQFESHRLLGLSLNDHRSGHYLAPSVHHIPNPQVCEITATQLAVDCQVEQGQVEDLMFIMEVDPNCPDVLWPTSLPLFQDSRV